MYILSTGSCPRICRPEAPCMITSATGTARWIASIRPQVPRESRARSQPHGLHHRQSECEKRCSHRQPRLRCRQADQGQEAACSGRYAMLLHASSPPPTFRIATAVSRCSPCSVCFPFSGNRRQRLSGPGLSPRPGRHPARLTEIVKRSDRVKGFVVAQALGGRTHHRLAQPLPPMARTSTATRSPSSSSRPFDSCSENSVILHKVSGRTLRNAVALPSPPMLVTPLTL